MTKIAVDTKEEFIADYWAGEAEKALTNAAETVRVSIPAQQLKDITALALKSDENAGKLEAALADAASWKAQYDAAVAFPQPVIEIPIAEPVPVPEPVPVDVPAPVENPAPVPDPVAPVPVDNPLPSGSEPAPAPDPAPPVAEEPVPAAEEPAPLSPAVEPAMTGGAEGEPVHKSWPAP